MGEKEKAGVSLGRETFLVRTGDNLLCKLCYNDSEKQWSLIDGLW